MNSDPKIAQCCQVSSERCCLNQCWLDAWRCRKHSSTEVENIFCVKSASPPMLCYCFIRRELSVVYGCWRFSVHRSVRFLLRLRSRTSFKYFSFLCMELRSDCVLGAFIFRFNFLVGQWREWLNILLDLILIDSHRSVLSVWVKRMQSVGRYNFKHLWSRLIEKRSH